MKFCVLFFLTLSIWIFGGFTILVKPPVHKIEQDTIEEQIQIAFTGEYRNDNILENSGQWYGVFPVESGDHKIIATRINVKDTIVENDMMPDHIIISVDSAKPLFLFKGVKTPKEGKQYTPYYTTKTMYPGFEISNFTVGTSTNQESESYSLYAQGSAYIDTNDILQNNVCSESGLILRIKKYSICLLTNSYNKTTKTITIKNQHLFESDGLCSFKIPSLDFVGDIDGDNKPDFLISYSNESGSETHLYLSSKMFYPVATWIETYGC